MCDLFQRFFSDGQRKLRAKGVQIYGSPVLAVCTLVNTALPVVGYQRSANTAQTAAFSDFVETGLAQQLN